MARRRRKEPVWPLLIVVGAVALGLGVGNVMTGPGGGSQPTVGSPPAEMAVDPRVPTPEDRIRVEVLNGGGVVGVAGEATDLLRDRGFDVVYFGNESSFGRDSSVVLDRTRREGAAEAVSRSLGIGATLSDPDASRLVDVTVLLGTDWRPEPSGSSQMVSPVPATESEGGERPWWDLRRLLEGGS